MQARGQSSKQTRIQKHKDVSKTKEPGKTRNNNCTILHGTRPRTSTQYTQHGSRNNKAQVLSVKSQDQRTWER